jgi:hypothetical protein
MRIKDLDFLPEFYSNYILKLDENLDLIELMEINNPAKLIHEKIKYFMDLGEKVYAPEKWPVSVIFQHCLDTERIFGYRALCIARGEKQALPGFDQDEYVKSTFSSNKTLAQFIEEFDLVRRSNILMIKGFKEEDLKRLGVTSNIKNTAGALCFALVGHFIHHLEIIEERYFPLIP